MTEHRDIWMECQVTDPGSNPEPPLIILLLWAIVLFAAIIVSLVLAILTNLWFGVAVPVLGLPLGIVIGKMISRDFT
jgi:CHASE2 domain-containing sensor protein